MVLNDHMWHHMSRVSIAYIKEVLNWVFPHHGVATTMKSHLTLKRMLIQPKDKSSPHENAEVLYHPLVTGALVYILVIPRGGTD